MVNRVCNFEHCQISAYSDKLIDIEWKNNSGESMLLTLTKEEAIDLLGQLRREIKFNERV